MAPRFKRPFNVLQLPVTQFRVAIRSAGKTTAPTAVAEEAHGRALTVASSNLSQQLGDALPTLFPLAVNLQTVKNPTESLYLTRTSALRGAQTRVVCTRGTWQLVSVCPAPLVWFVEWTKNRDAIPRAQSLVVSPECAWINKDVDTVVIPVLHLTIRPPNNALGTTRSILLTQLSRDSILDATSTRDLSRSSDTTISTAVLQSQELFCALPISLTASSLHATPTVALRILKENRVRERAPSRVRGIATSLPIPSHPPTTVPEIILFSTMASAIL